MPRLDDAYANGAYIADAATYPPLWAERAEAFRQRLGVRAILDEPYGPSDRMAYDMFLPQDAPLGTLIFVHGGYWRAFDRKSWSHFAAGAVEAGWAVAMPSYDLCPEASIALITQQIAQAVARIGRYTEGPITLAGHSAGGHLVARMCAAGMLPADVAARVQHVMPISPLADLEPLLETAMNEDFALDPVTARAESPCHQPAPDTPVTIWVGGEERPAFLEQAALLATTWGCAQHVAKGMHHFNVIDPLAEAGSEMCRILTLR